MTKTKSANRFYGIVGNGETCALVGPAGAIDWFCFPRFDSPFVFGRIIDDASGFLDIKPKGVAFARTQQRYRPATAILDTDWLDAEGIAVMRATDWMPRGRRELRRLLTSLGGSSQAEVAVLPTFDYRRAGHEWSHRDDEIGGVRFARYTAQSGAMSIHLLIPAHAVSPESQGIASASGALRLIVDLTYPVEIILLYAESGETPAPDTDTEGALSRESAFWETWLRQASYRGAYIEEFQRSLITMKLLTFAPTGAILAAGTTSLPQRPGTGSNWDYRFSWVRDGAYCTSAWVEAGFHEEAKAFLNFVFSVMDMKGKPWQPLYKIDGDADCSETNLDHLSGFLGDPPVRIGNLAYAQIQHDLEGEVLEALWDVYENTRDIEFLKKHWEKVQRVVQWVIGHWMNEDNGIWELREVIGHYTHSKVMCWSALHRAARIADALGHWSMGDRWRETASTIRADVLDHGWNGRMGAFTLAYGMPIADTCLLALPLSGMLEPNHPRVRRMVRRFESELVFDNLVARNIFEPLPFLLVTFWMARYYIMAGHPDKAHATVERSVATMTDLDLFCEHAVSAEDVPSPDLATSFKSATELLTAHESLASFGAFTRALFNYFFYRNPGKKPKKRNKRRYTAEEARMFKGNFPQVYSHEELVRTLVRLGI
jgi:alpha,alpha-trehalase